ncbi:MAG: HEPN domain-containing protein [Actinomycetota bacterium]
MQRDERAKEVGAWLDRARLDLRAAGVDLGADPPLTGDAAFHCQQAVEKALKGFLAHHDHPFRKTHDIGELAMACLEHDASLHDMLRQAAPMTEYAWRFRYPAEELQPDPGEIRDALRLASEVVERIESLVRA